ncbi:MAG: hypothetical protein P4L91_02125 [Burkholderiaceae bacterium]|nr:hypothetical protein [Burkholderiaceae bacterium]
MHSSTFSFDERFGELPWLRILALMASIFFAFVVSMEASMHMLGYHATVLDSMDRWANERARASHLGSRALVLIGASRIQLGIDTDQLRMDSAMEPVQLAIDGSSFVPVLRSMANDPSFTGTVVVDYMPNIIESATSGGNSGPELYVRHFESESTSGHAIFSLSKSEALITGYVREHLRSYADGGTPLTSLLARVLPREEAGQYLVTFPDRSRFGDYRLVSMPSFYYTRVAKNLGIDGSFDTHAPNAEQLLRTKIESIRPSGNSNFILGARYIKQLKQAIEAHGGRVLFVEMPTSGMVREIDRKRYPRSDFLDVFEREVGARVLTSEDEPALKNFTCPDGSHLDVRDRQKFTEALARSLGLRRQD